MKNNNADALADKIRGMLLLGAYGDVLGAPFEKNTSVAAGSFSNRLQARPLPEAAHHWGTWIQRDAGTSHASAIPTDDTCFRFFLLHPWLAEVASGNSQFDESSFEEFLKQLKSNDRILSDLRPIRDAQIEDWLQMFQAERSGKSGTTVFFTPGEPVVFGMFMYAEAAAIFWRFRAAAVFQKFESMARLDQAYASTATAFFATLVSRAIAAKNDREPFDLWFFRTVQEIIDGLAKPVTENQRTLSRLVDSMQQFGADAAKQSWTDVEFANKFDLQIIRAKKIPWSAAALPLSEWVFDPFRFLAQMVATIAFAQGDVFRSLKIIAHGTGDTDTTASILGTLMGAWAGEQALRQWSDQANGFDADAELTLLEGQLKQSFGVNLNDSVHIFQRLQAGESDGGDFSFDSLA